MRARRYFIVAGFLILMTSVELLTRATSTGYYLTQLTMTAYYTVVVIGLCLVMGYAGQISLGHAGFFAMGGYMSAMLNVTNLIDKKETVLVGFLDRLGLLVQRTDLYGAELLTVNPFLACFAAVLTTIVVAYVMGGPVLKLKGHYLAMATLGFGIIVYRIVLGTAIFGEADGLSDVPGFKILPFLEITGGGANRIENYYAAWGLVALSMLGLLNLVDSRVGRALRAIHGSEPAADSVGVDTAGYKLRTFVLSAAMASLAGVLLTHYNGGIGPSEASVLKSVRYVAIVAVGGMANLWGALIMSTVLFFLSLRGVFGSYDEAVFGSILIVIMLFAPGGITGPDFVKFIKGIFTKQEKEQQESPEAEDTV